MTLQFNSNIVDDYGVFVKRDQRCAVIEIKNVDSVEILRVFCFCRKKIKILHLDRDSSIFFPDYSSECDSYSKKLSEILSGRENKIKFFSAPDTMRLKIKKIFVTDISDAVLLRKNSNDSSDIVDVEKFRICVTNVPEFFRYKVELRSEYPQEFDFMSRFCDPTANEIRLTDDNMTVISKWLYKDQLLVVRRFSGITMDAVPFDRDETLSRCKNVIVQNKLL